MLVLIGTHKHGDTAFMGGGHSIVALGGRNMRQPHLFMPS